MGKKARRRAARSVCNQSRAMLRRPWRVQTMQRQYERNSAVSPKRRGRQLLVQRQHQYGVGYGTVQTNATESMLEAQFCAKRYRRLTNKAEGCRCCFSGKAVVGVGVSRVVRAGAAQRGSGEGRRCEILVREARQGGETTAQAGQGRRRKRGRAGVGGAVARTGRCMAGRRAR